MLKFLGHHLLALKQDNLLAQQRLFSRESVSQLRSCCGELLPNALVAHNSAPSRTREVGFDGLLKMLMISLPLTGWCRGKLAYSAIVLVFGPNALTVRSA
jgi:hypothetical protein